jgi:glycolate oxidase FAD binding subunit
VTALNNANNIGPSSVQSGENFDYTIDGKQPAQVCAPKNSVEIGEILRQANAQRWSVVPFGAGSKQHIGNPLEKFDVALSLENFTQIAEYEPQDLVVKAGSGCRLADLQATLAADHLCLPIDPASGDFATLGGIVSSHDSGPLRFSQGTIRDYLIGLSLVQPDGTWTKFGSRVVKNVTGYDMCKLYTGAFGTLGVLVDFFFKLKPLPPVERTVIVTVSDLDTVRDAIEKLLLSPLVPAAVEFLNPAALRFLNQSLSLTKKQDRFALVVRFGDVENAVGWQVEQLEKLWAGLIDQGIIVSDSREQTVVWRLLREDRAWIKEPFPVAVKLKVNFLPSRIVETVQALQTLEKAAKTVLAIKAHAGNGVIRAYFKFERPSSLDQVFAEQVQALRASLKPFRGTVVVEYAPPALKKMVDVWGYDFKDKVLMQRIRHQFDPLHVLNPGRFVV